MIMRLIGFRLENRRHRLERRVGGNAVIGGTRPVTLERCLAKAVVDYLRRVVTHRAICNGCFMPH